MDDADSGDEEALKAVALGEDGDVPEVMAHVCIRVDTY